MEIMLLYGLLLFKQIFAAVCDIRVFKIYPLVLKGHERQNKFRIGAKIVLVG